MKISFLQMKRALNVALFVLLLSVAGTKNTFAQTQLATLQHGDDLSVFYGTNAFVEAHNAAAGGDIITLSGGSFVPCTISKGITLHGAGCEANMEANTVPTVFSSDISLNVTDAVNPLIIEGVVFSCTVIPMNLNNPKFIKCYMNQWRGNSGYCNVHNAQFVNCFLKDFYSNYCVSTIFVNTVVSALETSSSSSATDSCIAYNSIVKYGTYKIYRFSAYNSIVIGAGYYYDNDFAYNCYFQNCIGIRNGYSNHNPFNNSYTSGCVLYNNCSDVFDTFTGTFNYGTSFALKDEIATGFLGTDGTQVGVYGGFMPYDIRPSYMVVRRCNVSNRTTADGKLNVDIEVITEGD